MPNFANKGEKIVLAVDTSTDLLACAVARVSADATGASGVRILASADAMCRRHANERLTLACQDVLSEAGLSMGDVDEVLVGRGPGSFTGVRIAVATAKGLSCGLGVPLRGGSTLDACAWRAWARGHRGKVAVALDAMRGEVYPGIYVLDELGAHRTFEGETVQKADACVAEWTARSDSAELLLTGNGLVKYRGRFEAAGFSGFADEEIWYPSSEGLVRAATAPDWVPPVGDADPALVLPVYTRLSDAEENERQRLGLAKPTSVAVAGVDDGMAGAHLQLRPMSVNDLDQVVALEAEVYAEAAHEPWGREAFASQVQAKGASWWVAHDQGTVIGFAGGRMAGTDFEVAEVAVAAGRRRQGIAGRLVARVAYDAQMLNAQTASLEVEEGNAPARALYERLGFRTAGRRPNYYGPGVAALIMAASLPLATDGLPTGAGEALPAVRPWPIDPGERTPAATEAIGRAGELILSIESSCDETALAVIDGQGQILANVVATSIDFHARFGGVVPEIASRKHVEAIVGVYEEVMARAGERLGCATLVPADLSAVAVTAGPGLVGALVVGVAFAKGLCASTGLPLVPVNHLEGHLMANLFESPDLRPPFVASLVSGGNTMLVHIRDWGDYEVLGATIDDAVGEAFDKVAKALGLGYPGGPVISRYAAKGNRKAIHFPRAMMHSGDYSFSLSGLKTAVITYIEGENKAGRAIDLPDLAASFEAAVIDVQVAKALTAVRETGVTEFCVGGGVAANAQLRSEYRRCLEREGVRVTVPPLRACGDNGAMIGLVGLRNFRAGVVSDLTLDANPNAKLGTWSSGDAPVAWDGEQDWLK